MTYIRFMFFIDPTNTPPLIKHAITHLIEDLRECPKIKSITTYSLVIYAASTTEYRSMIHKRFCSRGCRITQ